MKGYVVYQDRRYRVINPSKPDEAEPEDRLLRLRPTWVGKRFGGTDIQVPASMVRPWKRGSMRHLKGTIPHRGRPVHLHIDTATEIIRVKLKGKRASMECTFAGLYDLLARQKAINARREREFAKRTRRRK